MTADRAEILWNTADDEELVAGNAMNPVYFDNGVPVATAYAKSIPIIETDSTSTRTVITATVPGITQYVDGLTVRLVNRVASGSTTNCTLNVNGLGALPIHRSSSLARITTLWANDSVYDFVYSSTLVAGGAWIMQVGEPDTNTNNIAYRVRVSGASVIMVNKLYRYILIFKEDSGDYFATTVTSNTTGTTKNMATRKFDPHAPIYWYGTTTAVAEGAAPGTNYLYTQYESVDLRYSFNCGSTLVADKPVFIKCIPSDTDGYLVFYHDNDPVNPITQDLPTTEDGYVYLYLGQANSTYQISLNQTHPCYWYKGGSIREWNGTSHVIEDLREPVKNLVKYPYNNTASQFPRTVYGITYSLNNDGTITCSGVGNNSNSSYLLINGNTGLTGTNSFYAKTGYTYKFTCCPSGGSNTSDSTNYYRVRLYCYSTTGSSGIQQSHDVGDGITFSVRQDSYIAFQIMIAASVPQETVESLVFKPMLYRYYGVDHDYVPPEGVGTIYKLETSFSDTTTLTNKTTNNVTYSRVGDMVNVTIDFVGSVASAANGSWVALSDISPKGFRPIQDIICVAEGRDYDHTQYKFVSNGNIYIESSSTSNNSNEPRSISATWITADSWDNMLAQTGITMVK